MINNDEYIKLIDDVYKVIDDFSKLKNKTILIIGSTGSIGSFLVDTLMRRNIIYNENITIYAGSRSNESIEKKFKEYLNNKNFIPFPHNIINKLDINFNVDYIINAGSDSHPKSFSETPVEVMQSNIIGTNNLLECCKNKKTRFLFVSSGEVYGKYEGNTPIKEDYLGYIDNLKFRSCYPISKRAAETLCITYKEEYNVDVVIARLSHIYSPYYKSTDNKVYIKFLESALNQEDIIFKKGDEHLRSYTFIADAATGILRVLLDGKSGEAYNVSNTNSTTTIENMANTISKIAGVKIIYEKMEDSMKTIANPMSYAVLDNSKLSSLGWHPLYSFSDGIKRIVSIRKK